MAALDDPQKTLFHPFETGDIDPPAKGQRVLFFGAEPGFRLPEEFDAELTLVQGFKPDVAKLKASRHAVLPEAEGEAYDMALVLAGRHRGLNEARLLDAWERVRLGGLIVVGGSKEDGTDSLKKRIAKTIELSGSLSKYHGAAFWFQKDVRSELPLPLDETSLVASRFRTAPGMFSHDRIDAGSQLLAENLPADLSGAAADFCAGWGYLSVELLDRCPKIASLDLFEADHAALEAAKLNLADARVPTKFHWQDLAAEPVPRAYDVIVMNPPFHQGKAADPAIGNAMIRAASAALKPNGRLWLVANRGLPYEPALAAGFKQSGELLRDGKFKLLWAKR